MDSDSDGEQELFPIVHEYDPSFQYNDPFTVSGVLKAVVEGDLDKIKCLIASGKSVNINDNHGNTPLHVAVIKNLRDILQFLLTQEDISVNIRNFYGETPLFHAVKRGYKELVQLLIAAGANVNLPNLEEITPLHIAVELPDIAFILIENGANINAADYSGETPLHEAVNHCCFETVAMLLYYNADTNLTCSNNLSAFMKALICGSVEIQEALIDYVNDFNISTCDGMTVLGLALTHNTPFVKEIINRGADINYVHPTLNSFSLCVDVPNINNFKVIWNKNYRFQKLFSDVGYLEELSALDNNYFTAYLDIIINSGNIDPIVESLSYSNRVVPFLIKCYQCNFSLDKLTGIICLLCSYGYVPTAELMDKLYDEYGFSELFRILLYMNIIEIGNSKTMSAIIYNVSIPITNFMEDLTEYIENAVFQEFSIKDSDLYRLFVICKFILFPKLLFLLKLKCDTKCQAINSLPGVPSLLELSRNVYRDAIVKKFRFTKSSQYFSYLDSLNLSVVYKSLLSFKTPLYKIHMPHIEFRH